MNKKNKNPDIDFSITDEDIKAAQVSPRQYETISFGGLEWLVLEKQESKMLILSCDIMYKRYHHTKTDITWAECELRQYLNGEFLNMFNEDEKTRILKSRVTTNTQPWHGTDGGADTEDFVFLLSIEEIIRYFGDSGDMEKRKGWYWVDGTGNPARYVLKDGLGQFINDQFNTARIAKNADGDASWWRLRSPGRLNIYNVVVSPEGQVVMTGTPVENDNGIRPAMWIDLPKEG